MLCASVQILEIQCRDEGDAEKNVVKYGIIEYL